MPFWQAFAESHTGIRGAGGWGVNVHCRPYETFQEARAGILDYEGYDYGKLTVYIVKAETSREAGPLVSEAFRTGILTPDMTLVKTGADVVPFPW